MKTADKWDWRYSLLAHRVSKWSKDPKAKAGAVLLNRLGWPIALGYNGFPAGVEDRVERLQDGDLKNDMIVHAEQNVLLFSGVNARNGTLYVYGKPVCPRCAVLIIQAGVKRVVAIQPNPDANPESTTHRSGLTSIKVFHEAGITFNPLDQKILKDFMRHEEATAAIEGVRNWFGGALSKATHVDGQMARLIDSILEAEQLSNWLSDTGNWRGRDSQNESVELLWEVVRACNLEAVREAITQAEKYASEVRAEKDRQVE